MRKLKKASNSSQSARNVETRCFCTMGLTNLISGCVTAWPAGTRDTLLSSRGRMNNSFDSNRINVAVGTTIADRPPHRSVQARLRIRLLLWMGGGEACVRIRMQNAGLRNPPVQDRGKTIPSHLCALTATD